MNRDEQQILELFRDGDRALIAAEAAELERIYADDYIQYEEQGRATTKDDLIRNLACGRVRFLSMRSTGLQVRLLAENLAVVHGSEEDEMEQDGRQLQANYIYMDVVMKRDGRWQIVASQLTKVLRCNWIAAVLLWLCGFYCGFTVHREQATGP